MSSHLKGKFYPLSWREHHLPQGDHIGGALTDAVAAPLFFSPQRWNEVCLLHLCGF